MANPPILRGNRITAEQFNELVDRYHTYWSDDVTKLTLTFADLLADQSVENINLHATGWGQQPVEPSGVEKIKGGVIHGPAADIIYVSHTNRLINQINAGLYHIDSTTFNSNSLTKYAEGSIVYYDAYRRITEATDYIETQKLNIDTVWGSDLILDVVDGALDYSETVTWENEVDAKIKATFSSYQQARYFFNSGGKLVFDISSFPDDDWTRILNNMGTIMIGAANVSSSGGWIGTSNGGFYNAGALGDPATVYTYSDAGGDLVGGIDGDWTSGYNYASRRVYYALEGNELLSGEFEVYVNIKLFDPVGSPITLTIDMTAGFLLPIETPPLEILDSSLGDKFKTDLYTYKFIEREAPILSVDTSWT